MADLSIEFAGIKAPNPFWLASAPPTEKAYNVIRAFEAGWGGVVWKTLGEDPEAGNVSSRYSAHFGANREVLGFNNIELITDRSLEINLREITQVKKAWPDRALIVSLMVPCVEESWKTILPLVEATGCDGIELNCGCPHGMPERGMGAAVGQVPEYVERVTRWCKSYCALPVIVKLTPNITDIRTAARPDHGRRDRPRPRAPRPADLRHRRHRQLARRGGVRRPGLRRGAGVHGGHAAWLSHRRADEGRPVALDGQPGLRQPAGFLRQGGGQYHRLEVPGHQLPGDRPDRPGRLHRLRSLPHRLRRHRAPGHRQPRPGRRHPQIRGDRRRMRGLQPVPDHLPGAGLHRDGGAGHRQAVPRLAARSAQSVPRGLVVVVQGTRISATSGYN